MSTEPWAIVLGDLDAKLGVVIEEQSADRVVATMPVAANTQSYGRLHGGATAALAEAVGSWAGMIHASGHGKVCVGVDLNITHHRGARDGVVRAVATPLHRGRRSSSYEVVLSDESGARLATARITNVHIDPEGASATDTAPA